MIPDVRTKNLCRQYFKSQRYRAIVATKYEYEVLVLGYLSFVVGIGVA